MYPLLRSALLRIFLFLTFLSTALLPVCIRAQVYAGKPKLIVVVIIDQFRGDYLNRDHAEFKGRGFRLFTDEGAWFTDCYFDYANTKTAPGHATIGTGAYTNGHGIEANEWWDASRSDEVKVSSVQDERYKLVGLPSSSIPANLPGAAPWAPKWGIGVSPLNLRASTFGDELRLATQGRSHVYGISLKDRAAILPVGQSANGAFWIDPLSGQFITSTYYMQNLPAWAVAFNKSDRIEQAEKEAHAVGTTHFYNLVGITPAANSYEFDFAKVLIKGENLGQHDVTDLLMISLSANDIEGHRFGPDSDQEEQMILGLDKSLDNFFTWLDQNVGLKNVWLALTADHGIAPVSSEAAKLGIDAAQVDLKTLYEDLERQLNARFSPGQQIEYLMPLPEMPYLVLDKRSFEKVHVNEKAAEQAVAEMLPAAVARQIPDPPAKPKFNDPAPVQPSDHRLPPAPQITGIYTRLQLANGQLPPSEWGRELAHSYAYHGNWYVMLVLGAYQMENVSSWGGTTHFSPWNYDRHVPLAFYGAPFKPGEYHGEVAPVDLVTTFASLAGVNRPSAAVVHLPKEALNPQEITGHP